MGGDWSWYLLCVLAIIGSCGGIAGVNEGWAIAEKQIGSSGPWSPTVHIKLGWWNSTTEVTGSGFPMDIKVQGDAAKSLGTVAIVSLAAGCLLVAHLLVFSSADALGVQMPSSLTLNSQQKVQLSGVLAGLTLLLSVALYLALMFGAHSKIKDKFGDKAGDVWPRPDWSFGCAMIGSISLVALNRKLQASSPVIVEGYVPI